MVKISDENLSKIKGGSFLDGIGKAIGDMTKAAFGFFEDLSGKVETGIFGSRALKEHADKTIINAKDNTVTIDNTASNKAEHEYEMQQLKEFGAPITSSITIM